MAVGFPTGALRRIASQTPMSCCAAIGATTCTRPHMYTQKQGDVQHCPYDIYGVHGTLNLAEKCTLGRLFAIDWGRSTGGTLGVKCRRERHPGHPGYVIVDGQGQLRPPRNPTASPGVHLHDGCPPTPELRGCTRDGTRGAHADRAMYWLDSARLNPVRLGSAPFCSVPLCSARLTLGTTTVRTAVPMSKHAKRRDAHVV